MISAGKRVRDKTKNNRHYLLPKLNVYPLKKTYRKVKNGHVKTEENQLTCILPEEIWDPSLLRIINK